MRDRGMVKWAPYKSLIEQEDFMGNMKKARKKIEKPKNCGDKAEYINNLLMNYHGQEVTITIYNDGVLEKISGTITEMNTTYKYLVVNGNRYYLNNIIDVVD